MADNRIHIIRSKDGVAWTEAEWRDVLDEYDIDQVKQLYWQLFDQAGRQALNGYFKERIIKMKNNRKK